MNSKDNDRRRDTTELVNKILRAGGLLLREEQLTLGVEDAEYDLKEALVAYYQVAPWSPTPNMAKAAELAKLILELTDDLNHARKLRQRFSEHCAKIPDLPQKAELEMILKQRVKEFRRRVKDGDVPGAQIHKVRSLGISV